MSDLNHFEAFICVARSSSLSRAAEKLGITKASLSKQIKQLESQLKVDLFSRSGYRLTMTPYGETLLEQCVRLKRELDATRSLYHSFHEQPEGELKVVAFGYFAKQLIFPKLNQFLTRYPNLKLTVEIQERVPDLEKEAVDIALGYSLPVPDQSDIIQGSMGTTHYVLCGTQSYFDQFGVPRQLEALDSHRFIGHISRTKHIKLAKGGQLAIQPYLLLNSIEAMIECARLGLGLIQIPIYMVEKWLKNGELIEVLSNHQRSDEHVYYYYSKFRYIQPKVRKFVDFFLKKE